MCIALELNSRPTIRVVSRLYSKRTKPFSIPNEKALTSWSNRSDEFLRRADQFRSIKIQPKTKDLSMRLWGITTEFVGFIPQSFVLRSIMLGRILIYRNYIGSGTPLAAETEHSESRFRSVRISEKRCMWLT